MTAGPMTYVVGYPYIGYKKTDTEKQRAKKRKATSDWRARINKLNSKEKVEQLIYCNFDWGDKYITLTYRDECLPWNRKAVMDDFKYFRTKMLTRRQARGEYIHYIYVVEHKHGEARWHIHALISGSGDIDLQDVVECWPFGGVNIEYFSLSRAEELAEYFTKERPDYVGQHMWMTSRGLRRPTVTTETVSDSTRLTLPYGAIGKGNDTSNNEFGFFEYLKYFRAKD